MLLRRFSETFSKGARIPSHLTTQKHVAFTDSRVSVRLKMALTDHVNIYGPNLNLRLHAQGCSGNTRTLFRILLSNIPANTVNLAAEGPNIDVISARAGGPVLPISSTNQLLPESPKTPPNMHTLTSTSSNASAGSYTPSDCHLLAGRSIPNNLESFEDVSLQGPVVRTPLHQSLHTPLCKELLLRIDETKHWPA